MQNISTNRRLIEAIFVVAITILFGLGIGLLGTLALKFQIALGIALFGLLIICLVPQRKSLCLFLWVIIQPLSIEKILYTAPPLWESLRGQEIIINAGDIILVFLGIILLVEKISQNKKWLVWDKKTTLFLLLLVWATVSYLIHLLYYQSDFIQSSPIGLLILLRLLLFVIVIQSSIQTRADLIWVLVATMVILLFESALVFLSYSTGESYNFSRLIGLSQAVQSYQGGEGQVVRAVGTLGVANQQALFHALFSFLLVGLFAVKNVAFKNMAAITLLLSFTAIILTFARTAWFSIAIASFLLVAIFIKRQEITAKAWLIGASVFIAFAIVLGSLAQPIIDRLTVGDNGATDSRVRMIELAKDLFTHYPVIGVGPSGYAEAGLKLYPPGNIEPEWVALGEKPIVPPLGRVELATATLPDGKKIIVPLSVHNKYLLVLSEQGVVGLTIWLMILFQFFKEAKNCSQSKDPLLRFSGVAGLAILLVGSTYMMLDLFADEKTLQTLLFPLLVISCANRLAKNAQY